jgi:hypothetical protein
MEVVGQDGEPVEVQFHVLRVQVLLVLGLARKHDCDSHIGVVNSAHLFHQLDVVVAVVRSASTVLSTWPKCGCTKSVYVSHVICTSGFRTTANAAQRR